MVGNAAAQVELLKLLLCPESIALIKAKLPPEKVATIFCEIVNPHEELSTGEKAMLAGMTTRGYRKRKTCV